MLYHRWQHSRAVSRSRKQRLKALDKKVEVIVNDSASQQHVLADFPKVEAYLADRFPDVQLTDVQIFVVSVGAMKKAGWDSIGGCYVRYLNVALIKRTLSTTPQNKFDRLLKQACPMTTDVEDVVVHEMIHAVSYKLNRACSKFMHMEEEFVYTNCIDFYKQKGMDEDSIINNNFLPFCLNDLSVADIARIAAENNIPNVTQMRPSQYRRFLSRNAELLIPLLKKEAQQKARHMIDLYKKFGAIIYPTTIVDPTIDTARLKFATLDLS